MQPFCKISRKRCSQAPLPEPANLKRARSANGVMSAFYLQRISGSSLQWFLRVGFLRCERWPKC